MPNSENEVEYLVEENEFNLKVKKRRKPALLIIAISALILALGSSSQILLHYIDDSVIVSRLTIFYTAIVSSIIFVLFFILFLAIRTTDKKDIVVKSDHPKNDNITSNVEVSDGFVDLVEDDAYLAVEDEEATNKKEEVDDVDTFDLTTTLLNERLLNAFHNNSLHCDTSYLVGTLASTNLLFVNKNDQDEGATLDSIATGLSGKSILIDATKFESCNELISSDGFLRFIDESSQDLNRLYFVGIKNISLEKVKDVLSEFLEALFDKNNSSRVDITVNGREETHMIGQNLFFIVFKKEDEKILTLPTNILKYSSNINLAIKSIPFDKVELENRAISYYDFRRAINNSLADNFMSENRWVKIDSLASFLNTKKPYMISNDVLNNMESLSGVLLSLGTKKDTTFDRVCADILLPAILKDFGREFIIGDNGIYHYINDNFANVYTMPKTEALIKDARYLNKENNDSKDLNKSLFEEFDSIIEEDKKKKKSDKDSK